MRLNQVTLPVRDIPRARAFWLKLGFTQITDAAYYCRFEAPQGGSTLSIASDYGEPGQGPVVYFEFDSAEALDAEVARLESESMMFDHGPKDQSWLWREARLTDPDGNRLVFYHAGENRLNPPWRVEGRP